MTKIRQLALNHWCKKPKVTEHNNKGKSADHFTRLVWHHDCARAPSSREQSRRAFARNLCEPQPSTPRTNETDREYVSLHEMSRSQKNPPARAGPVCATNRAFPGAGKDRSDSAMPALASALPAQVVILSWKLCLWLGGRKEKKLAHVSHWVGHVYHPRKNTINCNSW